MKMHSHRPSCIGPLVKMAINNAFPLLDHAFDVGETIADPLLELDDLGFRHESLPDEDWDML